MRAHTFLLATTAASTVAASPVPDVHVKVTAATASCPSEDLAEATWTKLNLDKYLEDWAAKNYTASQSNNVQNLAATFGAPNFFCGLDNFCNAGQPCQPVQVPEWYILVAMQNWNSYMNSINTAITFASSILSLTLPSIVTDFYPNPRDDVTPLKHISSMFTTVIGLVPFTGPVKTAASALSGGVGFLTGQLQLPAEPDRFLVWSQVGATLGLVVTDYQAAVSTAFSNAINADITKPGGMAEVLKGGRFLGSSQNVTQADIQSAVTESFKVFSVGLALQAHKVFVSRITNAVGCEEDEATMCLSDGTALSLLRADGENAVPQKEFGRLMSDKYGISKDQYLNQVPKCFDANGQKQLVNPFDTSLPMDPKAQCLFNLIVCDKTSTDGVGIVKACRNGGNDV